MLRIFSQDVYWKTFYTNPIRIVDLHQHGHIRWYYFFFPPSSYFSSSPLHKVNVNTKTFFLADWMGSIKQAQRGFCIEWNPRQMPVFLGLRYFFFFFFFGRPFLMFQCITYSVILWTKKKRETLVYLFFWGSSVARLLFRAGDTRFIVNNREDLDPWDLNRELVFNGKIFCHCAHSYYNLVPCALQETVSFFTLSLCI